MNTRKRKIQSLGLSAQLFITLLPWAGFSQANYTPYTFTTIAGMPPSLGTADGTNASAQFQFPNGAVTDNQGNIYIADTQNHAIRKMTHVGTNWVVTTIAGLPGMAGASDGDQNTARFNGPYGIAMDPSGNIYVGDSYNNLVRKISPFNQGWLVSTLAGKAGVQGTSDGTGTNAAFYSPSGIALDAATNIYVTDTQNYTIRKMTPSGTNWTVTTIAGKASHYGSANAIGTNASFYFPYALAVDNATNIYVADSYNNMIREISLVGTNWNVSTIAGNANQSGTNDGAGSIALFSSPMGLYVDAATNLYISDSYNNTIREMTFSNGNWIVSTLAGQQNSHSLGQDGTNSTAFFAYPSGLTMDGAGNFFIADEGNDAIREMTHDGANWIVTTVTGTVGSTGSADGTNSQGRFYEPYGLTTDPAGNLYVADLGNDTIRKLSPSGTNWIMTTIAGMPHGNAYANGLGSAARFYFPNGMASDAAGNLYVADSFNNLIRKLYVSGTNWVVTNLLLSGGSVNDPNGLAIDAATNIYVTDTGNNAIRKLTPSGTFWKVSTLAGSSGVLGNKDGLGNVAQFHYPTGIAFDLSTNIYIADTHNNSIRKMTPIGTNWMVTTIGGMGKPGFTDGFSPSSLFNSPFGIAVDNATNIYVSDSGNNTIRKLTPWGTNWIVTTLGGTPGIAGMTDGAGATARFFHPFDIISDATGNIVVADGYNNTIRKGSSAIYFPDRTVSATSSLFSFKLAGPIGRLLIVQASTDLHDWRAIATNSIDSNGVLNFVDPASGQFSNRFYRAITP